VSGRVIGERKHWLKRDFSYVDWDKLRLDLWAGSQSTVWRESIPFPPKYLQRLSGYPHPN